MKIFLFYFYWQLKLQGRRKNSESVGLAETQLLFVYASWCTGRVKMTEVVNRSVHAYFEIDMLPQI